MAALLSAGCSRLGSSGEKYLDSGKEFLRKNDYARAILAFKNAVQASPKNPEPYYQLGLAYLGVGDWSMAAAHLKKATDLDPKHAAAQLRFAELMTSTGDKALLEDAENRLRNLFRAAPENLDALTALAVAEWKLARPEDAEQRLLQAFGRNPGHLNAAVTLARMKAYKGDHAGAEEVLKKAVEQNPSSANAQLVLGEFYLLTGKNEDAERQFWRALQIDGSYTIARMHLAAMRVRAGQTAEAEAMYRNISRLPDKQHQPVYGFFLLQTDRADKAIEEFRRLVKADGQDRVARSGMIAAYVTLGRTREAEEALGEALSKNPKDLEALLQRSAILVGRRKSQEAERDLLQVLEVRPNLAEAHYLLAMVYEQTGTRLNQRQALDEALQHNPAFLPARMALSMWFIRNGAAKAGLEVINEAPAAQENMLAVRAQQNWALLALGRMDEARKGVDDGLARARVPDLLLQAALLRLTEKRYAESRALAREALQNNPVDLRALEILARGHALQGQIPEAVKEVRTYVARAPKTPEAQHFLGNLMLAAGDRNSARGAFQAAGAAAPDFAPALLSLAQMEISEGRLEHASKTLQQVAAVDTTNTAKLWLGHIEQRAGNAAAAMAHYRAVLAADARHVTALNNLAYLLAEAGRPQEALKFAEKAKELAPDNAAVENTLGWVLYQSGLYSLAVTHLESADRREPSARRKCHLAMAYFKLGRRQQAERLLAEAVQMDPRVPERETARQLLASAAPGARKSP
jgi:tetratricopeptide (TPR) repeat protein